MGADNRGPAADPDDPHALTTEAELVNPNAPNPGGRGGGAREWGGGRQWGSGRGSSEWNPSPVPPAGRGAPATSPNTAQEQQPPDPTKDRIYPNESIEQDTQFTVVAVVVLDPKPPEPKPAADAEQASASSQ